MEPLDAGKDAPEGVLVTYWLEKKPEHKVTLSFSDSQRTSIKSFDNEAARDGEEGKLAVPAEAGMNRFAWDMRYPGAVKVPGDKSTEGAFTGPLAPPGACQVTIEVDGRTQTQSFEILKDPRVEATQEELEAQFDLQVKIRDRLSETHESVNKIRGIRRQVDEWVRRVEEHSSGEVISASADALKEKLLSIESELIQVDYTGVRDINNLPTKLDLRLAELFDVVGYADFAPPKQTYEVFEEFGARLEPQLDLLQEIVDKDVPEFENLVHELEIPAIVP